MTIPPPPDYPPNTPAPAGDWWDRLYDQAETTTPSAPARTAKPVARNDRLGDWWRGEHVDLTKPEPNRPDEDVPACEHPDRLEVRAQPTDELVSYLCPDCDEQLPAEEPEAPAAEQAPAAGPWLQPQPSYYPQPHMPQALTRTPEALSPKTRQLLYNAGAVGAGWGLGLLDLLRRALASCGADAGVGAALVLGTGGCIVIAHVWDRRTRHWWIGLAWTARIPLATAITALGLYTPGSTF